MVLKNYIDKKLKDSQGNPIPLKKPKYVSMEQWDKAVEIYKAAQRQGDKYPELTVAQAALESAWFKTPTSKYNYFGQKASKNQPGTEVKTKEVSKDKVYSTTARFRDYETLDEALADRVKKWGSKYENASNIEEALYSIWQYDEEKGRGTGYATDNQYDVKIKKILNMFGVPLNTEGQAEKIKKSKIQIPTSEIQEKTKDSLDENYFIEDLIDDGEKEQPKEDTIQQQISQIRQQFEQKQQNYKEQLKTLSFEPQPQQNINTDINVLVNQLFSDESYNYINPNEY